MTKTNEQKPAKTRRPTTRELLEERAGLVTRIEHLATLCKGQELEIDALRVRDKSANDMIADLREKHREAVQERIDAAGRVNVVENETRNLREALANTAAAVVALMGGHTK